MASWEINYLHDNYGGMWEVVCFGDNGVTTSTLVGNEYMIPGLLESCCGGFVSPNGSPNTTVQDAEKTNGVPFHGTNRKSCRLVVKGHGIHLITKNKPDDDASIIPFSLVKELLNKGYTAIRTLNISDTQIGLQYGKIIDGK